MQTSVNLLSKCLVVIHNHNLFLVIYFGYLLLVTCSYCNLEQQHLAS